MPGIAGIISRSLPPAECQQLVSSMTQCMTHESFYCTGTQAFATLGIFAGWTAHEGTMASKQTFWNERRDVALLFAGECFPDAANLATLAPNGNDIGTETGRWIIQLYEKHGISFLEQLNGLFSGLLIDLRSKRAYLFNDRYGIERIYWHKTNEATYFATEAKALLRILPALRAFDNEGLSQFLRFGCTLNWKTLFRGVQLAPGGTLWSIENGECRTSRYFTPSLWEQQTQLGEEDFEAHLCETFRTILPRYFSSSFPIGISLTGGLDTRMVMACLPSYPFKPICYTYAGVTGDTSDVRTASRVAQAYGLDHHRIRIGPNFFSSFGNIVDRTAYLTDGCFGAMGAHEIYLSSLARTLSPLRLTGVFGGEILRGVSTFKPATLTPTLFQTDPTLFAYKDTSATSSHHPVTFAAFREVPWSIYGSITACRSQLTLRTPFLDNAVVALAYRAPPHLRQSPISAIRFITNNSPSCAAIATDRGHLGPRSILPFRRLIAEATFKLDYYYNEGLPHALTRFDPLLNTLNRTIPVFGHHKYLHYRQWFKSELVDVLLDAVERARNSTLLNAQEVGRMAKEHISGAKNRILDIDAVLTLLAIERRLIRMHV